MTTALSNGAVVYSYDGQRERLSLNLRELSRETLFTRDMDAFWTCLQQWKHFNEDRDFPGDYAEVVPE